MIGFLMGFHRLMTHEADVHFVAKDTEKAQALCSIPLNLLR